MYEVDPIDLVEDDFALIYEHLVDSYLEFGESPEEAILRASRRIIGLKERMYGLGRSPFQGTLLPVVMDGLRRVTKDDGIFYFDIDESRKRVRVLAVFYSGQDHLPQILDRLNRPPT